MIREIKLLFSVLPKQQKRKAVSIVSLAAIAGVTEVLAIGALIPFLASVAASDPSGRALQVAGMPIAIGGEGMVLALGGIVVALAVAAAVTRSIMIWKSETFCARTGVYLVTNIYRRVMTEDIAQSEQRNSSEIQSAIDKVQALTQAFLRPLLAACTALIMALCLVILCLMIAPLVTSVALLCLGAVYLIATRMVVPTIRSMSVEMSAGWRDRTQFLRESLNGKREIMLAGRLNHFEEKVRVADRTFRDAEARNQMTAQIPRALFHPSIVVVLVILACVLTWFGGDLTNVLPLIVVAALILQRLLPLAQSIWTGTVQATGNRASVHDVLSLVSDNVPDAAQTVPRKGFASIKRLNCSDMSYAYTPGVPVFEGISFDLKQGEWLGITGRSGAGKSTLIDCVAGFRAPSSGEIRIDGKDLGAGTLSDWQASLALVREGNFLFDASFRDNICLGESPAEQSEERLQTAVWAAAVDELLDRHPSGLDADLGENGVSLSNGQRQRVALARALYQAPALLLLDEATSAVDLTMEAEIFARIRQAYPLLSVILVSHRTQSLAHCSRQIAVDHSDSGGVEGPTTSLEKLA